MSFSVLSCFLVSIIVLSNVSQPSHGKEISVVLQKLKGNGSPNERGKRKSGEGLVKYKFDETFFRSPQFQKFYTALREQAKGEPTWVELQSLTDSAQKTPLVSIAKRQVQTNKDIDKAKTGPGTGVFLKLPDFDKAFISELSSSYADQQLDQPIKIECPAMLKSRDCTPKPCCFCGEPLKPSCDDYEWKWCRISMPRKTCCPSFNDCSNLLGGASTTCFPNNKRIQIPDFSFDLSNSLTTMSPNMESARNKAFYYLMRRSSEGGNPFLKFMKYFPNKNRGEMNAIASSSKAIVK